MAFHKGRRVVIFRKSDDEEWDSYMDEYVGLRGIITDPDTSINDSDALVEISPDQKGTHRFPQDCLKILEE